MPRSAQKSKLAPWQQEDAARLKDLFLRQPAESKLSQERFAAEYGLGTQGNVWHYLNGNRPLNIDALLKFALGLRVSPGAISPTLAKEIARQAKFAESPAADKTPNRTGERVMLYGATVSHEAVMLAREWEKLVEPMKTTMQQLIELAVAAQRRRETSESPHKECNRQTAVKGTEAEWKR